MSAKNQKSYWKSRVRKRKYQRDGIESESKEYYAILQWAGKRKWIPLGTGNQDNAAAVAAQKYSKLTDGGWDALNKKPEGDTADITVGEFLEKIEAVSKVSPRTWGNYSRCLRQITAEIRDLESPKGAKYKRETYDIWLQKVSDTKLSFLTKDSLVKWTKNYVTTRDKGPDVARKARTSCNTVLRNAKALFNDATLDLAGLSNLANPFAGVKGYPPERKRYQSNFDAQRLLETARDELDLPKKEDENKHAFFRRKEAFKAMLLFGFTAIRRKEADLLLWKQINFQEGYIDICRTKYFEPKSESAVARIPLDEDAVTLLKAFRKQDPKGEFVLRGPPPRKVTTHSAYRCDKTFRYLIEWLQNYEVESGERPFAEIQKPLHEVRKEIGALLATNHGIFAAQRFLRHAEIATTERYYSDQKGRITAGLSLSSGKQENDDEK
ncbi:tyrosine-type recombinase/integrase [Verrucomicrobiales bacterium BCK34]|nr:tyrosine-type recombinase/integrase [Verrucomicrobiales bacterium BCK34]